MTSERFDRWRSLLIRLTQASPRLAVSGNVDEGLVGEGDVDLVAPQADWMEVEKEFRRWADGNGFDPVISCPHRPGVMVLVAMDDPLSPLYKLEVLGYRHFRGVRIFAAEDLIPAMEMDLRGWRRLRPGAGALIKLVPNGVTRWGGLKWKGTKAARVLDLLQQDPEGVHLASRAFSSMGSLVERAAGAASTGDWPRARMVVLEVWALASGLLKPAETLARLRYRISPAARCQLLVAIKGGRLVMPEAQMRMLAESHEDGRMSNP